MELRCNTAFPFQNDSSPTASLIDCFMELRRNTASPFRTDWSQTTDSIDCCMALCAAFPLKPVVTNR
jgi:hypothetical protein